MRIFVYEHLTSGALPHDCSRPNSLLAEGSAMSGAVLKDFFALADFETFTLVGADFDLQCPRALRHRFVQVASPADHAAQFEKAVRKSDAVMLIAPETDGVLTQLAERVERLGGRLISPSREFCAWASDKSAVYATLSAAGVPMPHGVRLTAADPWPRDFPAPAVLKPNDGCGSEDVRLVAPFDGDARTGAHASWRLEQFVAGKPVSLLFVSGPKVCMPLAPCSQRLTDDGAFQYLGGVCPLIGDYTRRVRKLFDRVVALLPPRQGFVGLDMVLGDAADGSEDYLIEINPRLTTSYVGLRSMYNTNLMRLMLDIVSGRPAELVSNQDHCEFDKNGTVQLNRPAWGRWVKGVLALDIGGANLKVADGEGFARSQFFPLWRTPTMLAESLKALTAEAPDCGTWLVTMTGELADCFRTKREGVGAILDAVQLAADRTSPSPGVQVYLTDGTFAASYDARRRYLEAAASNWHALASLVARRFADKQGVLIDIGSTTCDVIPFAAGKPTAVGLTDPDRLASGELVYTGVVRSPVCAVTPTLPWRGQTCGTAQELFATVLDAYLLLGLLPEDPQDLNTADGRPATREFAHDRMAGMVCADRESFDAADALAAAEAVRDAQVRLVAAGWLRVVGRLPNPPQVVVVSGQGEFLVRELLKCIGWSGPVVSFAAEFGDTASRIGPAYALAQLWRERG